MKASSLISNAKFLPPDNDGNRIVVADESGILHLLKQNNIKTIGGGGLKVSFNNSKNCLVIISNACRFFGVSKIVFENSDSSVVIIEGSKHKVFNLSIYSKYSRSNHCVIGKDFSCVSCLICFSGNADVHIGSDCMLSDNICIWNWDGHTILDKYGNCINPAEDIFIGDHVWIGMNASVSKGARIPSNSVVGQKSLVTHSFNEEGVILAGIPAKVVRKEISWDRTPSSIWKQNNF